MKKLPKLAKAPHICLKYDLVDYRNDNLVLNFTDPEPLLNNSLVYIANDYKDSSNPRDIEKDIFYDYLSKRFF